jgi:hypothetical protein
VGVFIILFPQATAHLSTFLTAFANLFKNTFNDEYTILAVFVKAEGQPKQYAQLDTKTLPLADVAERWGLEIKTGSFNGEYLGYYSSDKKEIVLATDSERTRRRPNGKKK